MIDKKKIELKKIDLGQRKIIKISIRITPTISKWLRESEISPTGLFYEALKEVGYKDG